MYILLETQTGHELHNLAPEFTSIVDGGTGVGEYDPSQYNPGQRFIPITSIPAGEVISSVDFTTGTYTTALPEPTAEMVNAERDRRKYSGFVFNGNTFDSDPVSLTNISGAGTLAGFAIASGAAVGDFLWHSTVSNPTTAPFSWITKDNQIVQMDAHDVFALGQEAANWVTLHTFAARTIKNLTTIPQDYNADVRWP